MLTQQLFSYVVNHESASFQLVGFDIEKPDLLQSFNKIKFNATEVFADFPKIDKNRCKFCGACVNYCDCGALHLDRNTPAMVVDPERCEACGQCIDGCSIRGISTKERLTGYILHGRVNGHSITIGKADDSHDFLVPLVCALNRFTNDGATSICDMGPGLSGFVRTALKNTTLALIIIKPSRGWKRNIQSLEEALFEMGIHYGIVINKYREELGFLEEVENYCRNGNLPFIGIIPFNSSLEDEKTFHFHSPNSEMEPIFASLWKNINELGF